MFFFANYMMQLVWSCKESSPHPKNVALVIFEIVVHCVVGMEHGPTGSVWKKHAKITFFFQCMFPP